MENINSLQNTENSSLEMMVANLSKMVSSLRKLAETNPEIADILSEYEDGVMYQRRAERAKARVMTSCGVISKSGQNDKLMHMAGWM